MTREDCERILSRTSAEFMREQAQLVPGHKPIHTLRVLRNKALADLREALAFMLGAESCQNSPVSAAIGKETASTSL